MKNYRLIKAQNIDMNPDDTLETPKVFTCQAGSFEGAAFHAPYDGVWLVFDEAGLGCVYRVKDLTTEEL